MFGGIGIKRGTFVFLSLLFFTGAVLSLSKVGVYLYDSINSKKTYSQVKKIIIDADIITKNISVENQGNVIGNSEITSKELIDVFNELTLINTDYAGFIYIADTNIEYPIMQGEDNIFYLSHDIYKQKSAMGSIFMDYRNNADFSDGNTLIYGHNMRDQSMFNNLLKYKDDRFAANSEPIVIITKTERLKYSVFAAYQTDKDTDYMTVSFHDEQDFDFYINDIRSRTDINIDGDIAFGDRLLTLSTCVSANSNYRYVVHAVLRG